MSDYRLFEINGKRPTIHPTAMIMPGAIIGGNVEIGENVLVRFGAVIYADAGSITIAHDACIGDTALIHTDGPAVEIGEFALVGHGAQICGGSLGNLACLGINAVLLPSSRVGDRAILGSGSLLLDDEKTQPQSFWAGSPAKLRSDEPFRQDADQQQVVITERFKRFKTFRLIDP